MGRHFTDSLSPFLYINTVLEIFQSPGMWSTLLTTLYTSHNTLHPGSIFFQTAYRIPSGSCAVFWHLLSLRHTSPGVILTLNGSLSSSGMGFRAGAEIGVRSSCDGGAPEYTCLKWVWSISAGISQNGLLYFVISLNAFFWSTRYNFRIPDAACPSYFVFPGVFLGGPSCVDALCGGRLAIVPPV